MGEAPSDPTIIACNEVFLGLSAEDVFDELFKLAPEKVSAVEEVRDTQVPSSPGRLPTAHLGRASGDKGEETGPWFTPAMGYVSRRLQT